MLPIMIDGRLVLMPFDADTLVASGLDELLDELATSGAAGDSALAAAASACHRCYLIQAQLAR